MEPITRCVIKQTISNFQSNRKLTRKSEIFVLRVHFLTIANFFFF